MQNITYKELRAVLDKFIGLRCSLATCTVGVGSMIILHFGSTYPEIVDLGSLGRSVHENAACRLLLRFAPWRCQIGSRIVCTSASSNVVGGPMEVGLNQLLDRAVMNITLDPITFDLEVQMDGRALFSVFCDQTASNEEHDNYSVRSENGYYIVGPNGRLGFQPN